MKRSRLKKLAKMKPLLWGAAAGAAVAVIITLLQASAIGVPTSETAGKIPRALAAGAVMGGIATWLGANKVTAGLTAGTGLYLLGIAKSATTPAGVAGF
jgi:hypothetical protein